MNKEVRWNKNMKKTRVQKSRDTVPLMIDSLLVPDTGHVTRK